MKQSKIIVLIAVGVFAHTASADVFSPTDSKLSLTLPDEWTIQPNNTHGLLIGKGKHRFGIRIHTRDASNDTLIKSLDSIIKLFESRSVRSEGTMSDYRVIGVASVADSKGTKGLRVTTGRILADDNRSEEPNVFHYLFIDSEKTPVCVCLYVSSGVRDAKSADDLILPNLVIK